MIDTAYLHYTINTSKYFFSSQTLFITYLLLGIIPTTKKCIQNLQKTNTNDVIRNSIITVDFLLYIFNLKKPYIQNGFAVPD